VRQEVLAARFEPCQSRAANGVSEHVWLRSESAPTHFSPQKTTSAARSDRDERTSRGWFCADANQRAERASRVERPWFGCAPSDLSGGILPGDRVGACCRGGERGFGAQRTWIWTLARVASGRCCGVDI